MGFAVKRQRAIATQRYPVIGELGDAALDGRDVVGVEAVGVERRSAGAQEGIWGLMVVVGNCRSARLGWLGCARAVAAAGGGRSWWPGSVWQRVGAVRALPGFFYLPCARLGPSWDRDGGGGVTGICSAAGG